MDTVGLLSRDLAELETLLVNSMLSLPANHTEELPKRILYCTDFFPHDVPAQQEFVDRFVIQIEAYLKTNREEINIADCWEKRPPVEDEAGGDIRKYLDKVRWHPYPLLYVSASGLGFISHGYRPHTVPSTMTGTTSSPISERSTKKSSEGRYIWGHTCAGSGMLT